MLRLFIIAKMFSCKQHFNPKCYSKSSTCNVSMLQIFPNGVIVMVYRRCKIINLALLRIEVNDQYLPYHSQGKGKGEYLIIYCASTLHGYKLVNKAKLQHV
jgi:hypothetical protein